MLSTNIVNIVKKYWAQLWCRVDSNWKVFSCR